MLKGLKFDLFMGSFYGEGSFVHVLERQTDRQTKRLFS